MTFMDDPKVVMLQHDLKGFYISSLETEILNSIHRLDKKMIQTVKVQNDDFIEVINLKGMNLIPSTLGEYISSLEQEIMPKCIMIISLEFNDDIHLHFETGELSVSSSDPDLIQTIAIELLDLCGYNGNIIFQKLKSNKQFYIAISEDSQFEYLYPHPIPKDDDID